MTITVQEIWEDFSQRLKNFILKRVENQHDAEDILQEVFCKIHSHVDKLRDEDKLEYWLYRITRNAIIDYYRQKPEKTQPLEVLEDVAEEPTLENLEQVRSCLRPMINLMDKKYSQALILTEFEGLTQKAMAEKLNLSVAGAKSRVQRAKGNLKEMLMAGCNLEFDHLGQLIDCWPKESGR